MARGGLDVRSWDRGGLSGRSAGAGARLSDFGGPGVGPVGGGARLGARQESLAARIPAKRASPGGDTERRDRSASGLHGKTALAVQGAGVS
eukprot:795672-Alexandrium_andersonii.AAC.1